MTKPKPQAAPARIATARGLEKLASLTTPYYTPEGAALLDVLKRIQPQLERRGWHVTVSNEGTRDVFWRFLHRATARTVCRVAHVTPLSYGSLLAMG